MLANDCSPLVEIIRGETVESIQFGAFKNCYKVSIKIETILSGAKTQTEVCTPKEGKIHPFIAK